MSHYAAIALLAVGGVGFSLKSIEFVRVTLPDNYGSNPGFGCYEAMVAPWFTTACIGVGLLSSSWRWGLITFGAGFLGLGFLAMLLSRVFGRRAE